MNRFISCAALLAVAAGVSACASGKVRAPSVASQVTGQPCSIGGIRGWKEVQSEGFSFCVPQDWALDANFESRHRVRYPSAFKMISYAGPDTLNRVVFEVPGGGGPKAELQQALERCGIDDRNAKTITIAGGTGCSIGSTSWTLNAPQAIYTNVGDSRKNPTPVNDFRPMTTITFSSPRIRGRSLGGGQAMTVLNSVRAVAAP